MARTITALAAVCAVLAPAAPAVAATQPATAIAPATPAIAATQPATAIALERSGGFAGIRDSFVVDRSTAGGRRALRLAASPGFRRLRGSYQPENPCCDRFSYRVSVTYRGGRHKTVSTVQGATAPQVLWDVVVEVERIGVRPPLVAR